MHRIRPSLRGGGGRVDTTGAWLVGAKGEYPLHRPYLLVIATTYPVTSAPLAKPLACAPT
jgi:hypothetical protein